MKKSSSWLMVSLVAFYSMQTGCSSKSNFQNKSPYVIADELKIQGDFYKNKHLPDSALGYYNKCLLIFRNMEPHVDSNKDSKFIRAMIITEGVIAGVYNENLDTNNSILYATDDLKWNRLYNFPKSRLESECIAALNLCKLSDKTAKISGDSNRIFNEAKKYIVLIGPDIDSLSPHDTSVALCVECEIAGILYKKIGDSSRSDFYYDKYKIRYNWKYGHPPENLQ